MKYKTKMLLSVVVGACLAGNAMAAGGRYGLPNAEPKSSASTDNAYVVIYNLVPYNPVYPLLSNFTVHETSPYYQNVALGPKGTGTDIYTFYPPNTTVCINSITRGDGAVIMGSACVPPGYNLYISPNSTTTQKPVVTMKK